MDDRGCALIYVSRGTGSDEVVRLYWAFTELDDHDGLLLHGRRCRWAQVIVASRTDETTM